MPSDEDRRKLIEQYLATRRGIKGIERKALQKLGSQPSSKVACSFCSRTSDEVPIIIEGDKAFICSECVKSVGAMLNGDERQ